MASSSINDGGSCRATTTTTPVAAAAAAGSRMLGHAENTTSVSDDVFEQNSNSVKQQDVDTTRKAFQGLGQLQHDPWDTDAVVQPLSSISRTSSKEERDDKFTLCPLCGNTFEQPKMLPCLHTFCLNCLEMFQYENGKGAGGSVGSAGINGLDATLSSVTCPRCRGSFPTPRGGLESLPVNSFFARLSERRRTHTSLDPDGSPSATPAPAQPSERDVAAPVALAAELPYCAICSQNGRQQVFAKFVCVDCSGSSDDKGSSGAVMCEDCTESHRHHWRSKAHHLDELVLTVENEDSDVSRQSTATCLRHPTEPVVEFCIDCQTLLCVQCYQSQSGSSSVHRGCSHRTSCDLTLAAQTGRTILEQDAQIADELLTSSERLKTSIILQRDAFVQQLDEVEVEIADAADMLLELIESHRQRLLIETQTIRDNTLTELNKLTSDIEANQEQLEGLRELSTELLTRGDEIDVAALSGKLRSQREVLESMQTRHDVSVCVVRFKPATASITERHNILGKLAILDVDSSDPYVTSADMVYTYVGNKSVAGLTILDAELYIVREQQPHVEVYDIVSPYTALRRLTVTGLRRPSDLAAAQFATIVYVADASGSVYVMDSTGKILARMQMEGEPQGLYVARGNVYVTCSVSRLVKEYTADGATCLRTVRLQQDVRDPWQSIPLTDTGRYLVCHGHEGGRQHRVCVVDNTGKVIRGYGGANGSGVGRLDSPLRIIVDSFGYVFVLDRNNDRILLLSPNLVYVRDVIGKSMFGYKQPRRMWLDVSTGSLYVGFLDGRVIIFRVLKV